MSVLVIGVAALYMLSAEAANENVMFVPPGRVIVNKPLDESTFATIGTLLE